MAVASTGRSLVTYLVATAMAVALVLGAGSEARAATVVFTSGAQVDTWDPIFPASVNPNWPTEVCVSVPAVGLGAAWVNPHKATSFGTGAHPWQGQWWTGFTAEWINAWSDIGSRGAGGHSWTKYSTQVSGTGDFVLNLLADNCSWIYLDGTLVGVQNANLEPRTYPVHLSGTHALSFLIFDGGGAAGGMYRLETNTGTVFTDTDGDGLADVVETQITHTNPQNPDTDGDGVSDGAEVAAGTDPLVPNRPADTTPPTIAGSATPTANLNGWNNTDVTVSFTCVDEAGGSGLASCGPTPVSVTAAGTTTVLGTAADVAGNTSNASVAVKIDKTAPTISASASPGANANGWNNTDVTVTFACSDGLSGVASCAVPVTVSSEGTTSVSGSAKDNADNPASAVATVQIDKTAPAVSLSAPSTVVQGQAASASVSANDALSGVASGTPTSVALDTSTPGAHGVSLTVFDKAGNSTTASLTYTAWSVACGLPPVVKNGAGTGQFNAGSSIPVKCRITDGTNVITTATGTATISNGTTTFSQALKYDPTDQQYVAPVKTEKAASGAYNVSVAINGVGTVAVASIQLR